MTASQPLPDVWLVSDERNDANLEAALARLPAGSGFVYRHYHLEGDTRRRRFDALLAVARKGGHVMLLAGDADLALEWGADGIYGPPGKLGKRPGLLRLATAHDAREIYLANRNDADALFLSPVFATRSHPDGRCLGVSIFRELAARSRIPVIALGGMTAERAAEMDWPRWAAIDALG